MQKLSAIIITLNEESCIENCLKSLSFCDEIIVVDSGSSDNTVALCEGLGAKVVVQEWKGFGPQKHHAVSCAEHDWVLCVDADEMISEELQESIKAELANPAYNAYKMPRCNNFLGRALHHGEGYPDKNLRLFNRQVAQWSDDLVHEKVETTTSVGELQGDIIHHSAETLEKYLANQNSYTSIQANKFFEEGKSVGWGHLLFSPLIRFIKFYIFKLGFLDGLPGFIHISIGCRNSFVKYAKVIEKQKEKQKAKL